MASNQLNEQELQFKKRARRRLVGAIALVLLMVTILPMVLDDRANKEPQQEIAITIPSQDNKDFTSKVVPVPETTAAPAEAPAPAEQDAAEPAVSDEPSVTSPEKVEDKAPPMAQAKPEQPKLEQPKAAPAKPAEASAAKEATLAKPGHMSVQIGVFSDASNVKQLQQKLQSLGYQSYTEKIATSKGEKIRLRAGPFASRAEAEAALAKVKSAGMTGMVVSK